MNKQPFEGTEPRMMKPVSCSMPRCTVDTFFPLSSMTPGCFSICLLLTQKLVTRLQTRSANTASLHMCLKRAGSMKLQSNSRCEKQWISLFVILILIQNKFSYKWVIPDPAEICGRLLLSFCIPLFITSCVFSQQEMSAQQLLVRRECLLSSQLIWEEYTCT